MKGAIVVGLVWGLILAVAVVLFPVFRSPSPPTWQESIVRQWAWVVASGVVTGLVTGRLTRHLLSASQSSWRWVAGWLTIGIAAAGSVALAISLETALEGLGKTSDLGEVARGAAVLGALVFVIAAPLTLAVAVSSLPFVLIWHWCERGFAQRAQRFQDQQERGG